MSPVPDSMAWKQDSIQHPWDDLHPYAFPCSHHFVKTTEEESDLFECDLKVLCIVVTDQQNHRLLRESKHCRTTCHIRIDGIRLSRNEFMRLLYNGLKQSFLHRELKPPSWNVALLQRSLTCLLYELLKLPSNKYLAHETRFLLSLASAKRVSEHELSISSGTSEVKVFYLLFVPNFCSEDGESFFIRSLF